MNNQKVYSKGPKKKVKETRSENKETSDGVSPKKRQKKMDNAIQYVCDNHSLLISSPLYVHWLSNNNKLFSKGATCQTIGCAYSNVLQFKAMLKVQSLAS